VISSVNLGFLLGCLGVNVLQYDVYTWIFENGSGSWGVNVLLYDVYTLVFNYTFVELLLLLLLLLFIKKEERKGESS